MPQPSAADVAPKSVAGRKEADQREGADDDPGRERAHRALRVPLPGEAADLVGIRHIGDLELPCDHGAVPEHPPCDTLFHLHGAHAREPHFYETLMGKGERGLAAIWKGDAAYEGGALLVSAGVSVWLLNVIFRIGVRGDRERDDERPARAEFERPGRWPDETPE